MTLLRTFLVASGLLLAISYASAQAAATSTTHLTKEQVKAAGSGNILTGGPTSAQIKAFLGDQVIFAGPMTLGPVTFSVNSTDGAPKILLTCGSVPDSKPPQVTNCRLSDGATIADVVNAMTEMQDRERKQYRAELRAARRRH